MVLEKNERTWGIRSGVQAVSIGTARGVRVWEKSAVAGESGYDGLVAASWWNFRCFSATVVEMNDGRDERKLHNRQV